MRIMNIEILYSIIMNEVNVVHTAVRALPRGIYLK